MKIQIFERMRNEPIDRWTFGEILLGMFFVCGAFVSGIVSLLLSLFSRDISLIISADVLLAAFLAILIYISKRTRRSK